MRRRSRWLGLASALSLVLVTNGCAGSQDGTASAVAQEYAAALGAGDGARACAVLAPSVRDELEQSSGKPCGEAVIEEAVPGEGENEGNVLVEVYGTSAQIRLSGDVLFLTRFQHTWRITAASCSSTPREVYECRIKGA